VSVVFAVMGMKISIIEKHHFHEKKLEKEKNRQKSEKNDNKNNHEQKNS
jgi:hypothetical protein